MKVEVLGAMFKPQQMSWLAAHQDYSSEPVYLGNNLNLESWYGDRLIQMLLAGGKGHFGCLEHPQIIFNWAYVPHSTMMQARTHRVGVSFDVQSFRYTSDSILSIETEEDLEKAFYFRPIGSYSNRQGKRYDYTVDNRIFDKDECRGTVRNYKIRIAEGESEEHARDCLTSNYRQHAVVSFNARSLMHFFDLRAKKDAQLEIQWLCELMMEKALDWMPEIFQWYKDNRWTKAKLAP